MLNLILQHGNILIYMGINPKPKGTRSTKLGKAEIIERTKIRIENCNFILLVPFDGMTKENTDLLKNALPSDVVASVVKNSLLRLAIKNTPFECMTSKLTGQNLYIFIPDGRGQVCYAAVKRWQEEVKRTEPEFDPRAVAIEGKVFVGKGLTRILNIPSRIDMLSQTLNTLRGPVIKLNSMIKSVPYKFIRALGALQEIKGKEANTTNDSTIALPISVI